MTAVQGTRCGTHRLPGERYTVKARTNDINISREKLSPSKQQRGAGVIAPLGVCNLIGWLILGSTLVTIRDARSVPEHKQMVYIPDYFRLHTLVFGTVVRTTYGLGKQKLSKVVHNVQAIHR